MAQARDILPGDADGAAGRFDQSEDGAADGGLSATGFADQAERFPSPIEKLTPSTASTGSDARPRNRP